MIGKKCPQCQCVFSRPRNPKQKYCSVSCARSGSPTRKRERIMDWCHNCWKSFETFPSGIKKRVGDKGFCSRKCWYAFNTGPNHVLWGGGQDERNNPEIRIWRKKIWERDGGFCQLCFSVERLEVHHIRKFRSHPELRTDIDNGILICRLCHQWVTGKEEQYEWVFDLLKNIPTILIIPKRMKRKLKPNLTLEAFL